MKAPERIVTDRLELRRPVATDADAVFARYAGDPRVGEFLAWPVHRSLDDTRQFLAFADAQWQQWPAGPFLIFCRDQLIGSTGLAFESPSRASTGYVLAVDSWGRGYATEAVLAMKSLAGSLGVKRLYAGVHPDHRASARVLIKGGFRDDGIAERCAEFPNQSPGVLQDVRLYAVDLDGNPEHAKD